jgi:hypothetical protein
MVIDAEYLAQLRANAEEVRADLQERELVVYHHFEDPEAVHEEIMAATQPPMPTIVRKTNESPRRQAISSDGENTRRRVILVPDDDSDNGDNDQLPPIFNDEQTDALADVIADLRMEFQATVDDAIAPLRERIAVLEGKLDMLVSMVSDNNKSFTASETVRKLQVTR